VVALLVALPLNGPLPLLPNPIRPDHIFDMEVKPHISVAKTLIDSYGVTPEFLSNSSGRSCQLRPFPTSGKRLDPPTSLQALHDLFIAALKAYNVLPNDDGNPELYIVWNANFSVVLSSGTVARQLPRRTVIMTIGPALQLHPNQWTLRPIWTTGGLVTFTPTFILRSPEKFTEIMKMIRCSDNWGAYVIPAVITWASTSWTEPA
jgi:hypothetical protein